MRAPKKPFCVKQGRRVCGLIRASPYPVIPASPGESETRRVPAPSHLAQRDVAKTHVSPSLWLEWAPGREPVGRPRLPGGRVDSKRDSTTPGLYSLWGFFSSI